MIIINFSRLLIFAACLLIFTPINSYSQQSFYNPCYISLENIRPLANSEVSGKIKITFTQNVQSSEYCNYPNKVECTYSVKGGFADKTYTSPNGSYDTSSMESGTYKASISCRYSSSLATNRTLITSGTTYFHIIRDTTPPELTISSLTEGQEVYGEIAINTTVSDLKTGNSAIKEVHFFAGNEDLGLVTVPPYNKRFNTTNLPNGPLRIFVRASDVAGNTSSAVVNLNVKNYASAPTIQIVNLQNNQTVSGSIVVQVNATDDGNVRFVKFYVDGTEIGTSVEPPYNYTLDSSKFPNGLHQLGAVVEDFDGLLAASAVDLNFENFDRKAPFVQFRSPLTGTIASGQVLIDLYADDESGIRSVQLYLNDTVYTEFVGNNFQAVLDTTKIKNGLYYLTALATDNFNNLGYQTILLIVRNGDSLEPSVGIMLPQESSVIKGLVTIVANAVDNVAVDSVEFYVDDQFLGTSRVSPYQFKFDSNKFSDGAHTITAIAYDFTGFQARHVIRVVINNGSTLDSSILPLAARILPAFIYGNGDYTEEAIFSENIIPEIVQRPETGDNDESSFSIEDLKSVLTIVSQSINSLQIPESDKIKVSKQNPEHSKAIKMKLKMASKGIKSINLSENQNKNIKKVRTKFGSFKSMAAGLLKSKGLAAAKMRNKTKKAAASLIKLL